MYGKSVGVGVMPRGKDLKQRKLRSDRQSEFDQVPCKDCGLHFLRCHLSKAGLCHACSARRVEVACLQLRNKRGPVYGKWVEAVTLSKINMKGGNNA